MPERLETTPEEDTSPAEIMATLTPRERKVLQLLAEDLTTQEVAGRLAVSQTTVRQHFRRAIEAFGERSNVESSTRPGTIRS